MCTLHLRYAVNAILISHINHYHRASCLAIYWEVSEGCSDTICSAITEVKHQEPLLLTGLASSQVFLPKTVRVSTEREAPLTLSPRH